MQSAIYLTSGINFCVLQIHSSLYSICPYVHVCQYLQAELKERLHTLRSERLAVMDELCEYLSEIPSVDISTFFKPGATFVQKRLALRYILHVCCGFVLYCVENFLP